MSRYDPHRTRPEYLAGPHRLPLEVERMPALGEPDDPEVGLPVLAGREVDGRRVEFALIVGRPALLGHVGGLDTPRPIFTTSDPLHPEWAASPCVTETIVDIARFTWHHRHRLLAERLHEP